jgi:hypothetical protein
MTMNGLPGSQLSSSSGSLYGIPYSSEIEDSSGSLNSSWICAKWKRYSEGIFKNNSSRRDQGVEYHSELCSALVSVAILRQKSRHLYRSGADVPPMKVSMNHRERKKSNEKLTSHHLISSTPSRFMHLSKEVNMSLSCKLRSLR